MALEARFEYRQVRVDGDNGPIVAGFCAVIPAEGLTVMVGRSGAGKTTLLRLLNRLDDPDDGVVLIEAVTFVTTTLWSCVAGSSSSARCRSPSRARWPT